MSERNQLFTNRPFSSGILDRTHRRIVSIPSNSSHLDVQMCPIGSTISQVNNHKLKIKRKNIKDSGMKQNLNEINMPENDLDSNCPLLSIKRLLIHLSISSESQISNGKNSKNTFSNNDLEYRRLLKQKTNVSNSIKYLKDNYYGPKRVRSCIPNMTGSKLFDKDYIGFNVPNVENLINVEGKKCPKDRKCQTTDVVFRMTPNSKIKRPRTSQVSTQTCLSDFSHCKCIKVPSQPGRKTIQTSKCNSYIDLNKLDKSTWVDVPTSFGRKMIRLFDLNPYDRHARNSKRLF